MFSHALRLFTFPKVADVYKNKFLEDWADITRINKPIIAAVSGYAVRPSCRPSNDCSIYDSARRGLRACTYV